MAFIKAVPALCLCDTRLLLLAFSPDMCPEGRVPVSVSLACQVVRFCTLNFFLCLLLFVLCSRVGIVMLAVLWMKKLGSPKYPTEEHKTYRDIAHLSSDDET